MSDRPDIRLEVGGQLWGGWTSIEIRRGLEQCAGTFSLDLTDRWPGQESRRSIKTGSPCRVLIDKAPVITGYIDEVEAAWDATTHSYRVSGRDKTCDLVDCCPPSTQIAQASLPDLARRWAALFGIEVVVAAECNKPVPSFKSDEGDTCFEMLEKLARANAVMLTSDGEGRLVITRAGTEKAGAALSLGQNLLHLSMQSSMENRFSEITVKGQSAGSQGWNSGPCAQGKGVARDEAVPRYRPLTLVAEQEEFGNAGRRAQHEVNIRYGKGHNARARVCGWYAKEGELWQPNRLADIMTGDLLVATWLITEVTWRMDEGGCLTELTLHPAEAFDLVPVTPKSGKGKAKGKGKKGKASNWPGLHE